jgi:3,4-dihydroxy 2-butanone 4-phosphate synthase/GTP cyclohydrolase II
VSSIPSPFASIEEAIEAFREGRMVVVVDDEDRENEGDLIMPADTVTPEDVAFYLEHTSGMICVSAAGAVLDALELPLMVEHGTDPRGTAFTITVDAARGVTTGISADDRARTVRLLADPAASPGDFVRPGHVFPLRAREGGVLKRGGHTEAGVDLARLAGRRPLAMLAEITSADKRSMARLEELAVFAKAHDLLMISIADLIRYRAEQDRLVVRVEGSDASIPTEYGVFHATVYRSVLEPGDEHLALVLGEVEGDEPVLVRVHSECLTGDIFGSFRCDCGPQLRAALERIGREGRGVLVYLRGHEGRGIGLGAKLRAYHLQEFEGLDTVEANQALGLPVDAREYGIGAQILRDLGVRRMRLLTNNPAKYGGLSGFGLEIVERVPIVTGVRPENANYLATKAAKLGHLLDEDAVDDAGEDEG